MPRNPPGSEPGAHGTPLQRVVDYHARGWLRNVRLGGVEGEGAYAARLG
jgi:hypothetical protein